MSYSRSLKKEIRRAARRSKNPIFWMPFYPIKNMVKKIDWGRISMYQELSEEFMHEFQDYLDWGFISEYQSLSEKFMEEHQDKIYWCHLHSNMSEEFIEKLEHRISWYNVSRYQNLSEKFIEKHADKVNWEYISVFQKLSEEFIEKFQNMVIWEYVAKHQKLSEKFIEKFEDRMSCIDVVFHQKLSEGFLNKYVHRHSPSVEWRNLVSLRSWLYASVEEKEKYIKEATKYKIKEDEQGKYILAYKGIRRDNYSRYSFRYKYEVGQEYEAHCDCDLLNNNSFGLSAWTLNEAKAYCNDKIILVKIYLKDIGAVAHDGNKIRCFKFKVMEEVS